MIDFLKKRWLLLLLLTVFVILKIPHLSYPYYWDESVPYAPAIRAMYEHGVSLMPDAIETVFSRGHPLFFHAAAASWMKIFGTSHFALHSFALLLSVLLLILVHEAALRLFNGRVAILATVLILLQEIFFVHSSFVLPEVMVALTCFGSMYYYIRERYVLTTLFLTMLFFTKETGLVMGFVLGIDAFIGLFHKQKDIKTSIFRLLSVAIPCLFIGVFFLVQKHILGWYVFPDHTDLIRSDWDSFWYPFRTAVAYEAFYKNYKYYYYLLIAIFSIVAAIKIKNLRYVAVLLPTITFYYCAAPDHQSTFLSSIWYFLIVTFSWFGATYLMCHKSLFANARQRKFIALSAVFIYCFFIFSALNFYTSRYLIPALVPLLLIVAILIDFFVSKTHKALYAGAGLAFMIIGYFAFKNSDNHGDTELGAFDGMDVHSAIVDYMEQHQYYDKQIGSGPYLENAHLSIRDCGFLKKGKTFDHIGWGFTDSTDLIIFDNIENDDRYNDFKKDTNFVLEYRVEKGKVWGEIYRRAEKH